MSLPYIGFSNATLAQQPEARPGDLIRCGRCARRHRLRAADDGSTTLLWYRCGGDVYLGALAGRLIVGVRADVRGSIPDEEPLR